MLGRPIQRSLAVAVTTILVVIASASYSIYADHQEAIESNRLLVRDLAHVVSDHAAQSLRSTDASLREIRDAVLMAGGLSNFAQGKHWPELKQIAQRIPGAVGVVLVDPDGKVVAASNRIPPPPISLANRSYMQALAQADTLDVGPARQSWLEPGEVAYTVNRRLIGQRGEFIGVVSAEIATRFLTDIDNLVGASKSALIVVASAQGEIVARRPLERDFVGRTLADSDLFRKQIPGSAEGAAQFHSPLDRLDRQAAWHVIEPFKLVAIVGIESTVVEKDWWRRTARNVIRTALALLVILAASLWSISLLRRQRRSQRRLAAAVQASETVSKALQAARRDHLTGLPARALFIDLAAALLAACGNNDQRLAIIYVDLDCFKEVNDALGHAEGDLVLVEAAQILRAMLREGDVAGRLGGDEFAACVMADTDRIEALASMIGTRIVDAIGAGSKGVGCSVGIAFCSGGDPHALATALKHADEAMYEAKRRGKGRLVISARSHLPAGKPNVSDLITGSTR